MTNLISNPILVNAGREIGRATAAFVVRKILEHIENHPNTTPGPVRR